MDGVVIQMLAIDVGDHGEDRAELQEGAVAFVGFNHQKITLADARVGAAHGCGLAPDDYRGIEARGVENGRGHRCGGGFAVAARDRDAVLQAHQLGQKLAPRDQRDFQTPRFEQLGILWVDRRAIRLPP